MPRKRSLKVFVFPMSELTNKLLASRLDADQYGHERLTCADGHQRALWEVKQEDMLRLEEDKSSLHLVYDTYVSEDGSPPKHCSVENLFHDVYRKSA